MRKRRRTRPSWFPLIPAQIGENGQFLGVIRTQNVHAATTVDAITSIVPVTWDVPFEEDFAAPGADSLSDVIGSSYTLYRLVGKCFTQRQPNPVSGIDNAHGLFVTCGFFVARANDSATGGGVNTPIGSATAAERFENYSPQAATTLREPWIWRRSWLLGAGGRNLRSGGVNNVPSSAIETANYPATSAGYGSVLDGPHIDTKMKRRIGNDDRLFFACTSTPYPFNTASAEAMTCDTLVDLRILGMLRKGNKNRSSF